MNTQHDTLNTIAARIPVQAFGQTLAELGWMSFTDDTTVTLTLPVFGLESEPLIVRELHEQLLNTFASDCPDVVVQRLASKTTPESFLGARNIVLVSSGKGGVGKSTVASNLACALQELGARVGIVDADVYGPSVPTLFGIQEGSRPASSPGTDGKPLLIPFEKHGLQVMSMGFLVPEGTPMVWRGPMIASACLQLFHDVKWTDLDYLVVDLPPGTGDIHLSIAQQLRCAGHVIVSTPQSVALADVRRAKNMFDKVNVPCLGIVENMSYFLCDQCDTRHALFASDGAKSMAETMSLDFLGALPLEQPVRECGDHGTPLVIHEPESSIAKTFRQIAANVSLAVEQQALTSATPSISIKGMPKTGSNALPLI